MGGHGGETVMETTMTTTMDSGFVTVTSQRAAVEPVPRAAGTPSCWTPSSKRSRWASSSWMPTAMM